MSSSRLDVLEVFAEAAAPRVRREYLEPSGFRFFRRAQPRRAPTLRPRDLPLAGVRAFVRELRAHGWSPTQVQRWVSHETSYTLRQVFSGCADEFERRCYRAG